MNARRRRLLHALSGAITDIRKHVRLLERNLDDQQLRERQQLESVQRAYAKEQRRKRGAAQ